MPIEIDWKPADEENIKQLIYSREWWLKPCHKTTASRAWTTILNLNDNLTEAYQKLEAAEKRIQENNDLMLKAATELNDKQTKIANLEKEKKNYKDSNNVFRETNNDLRSDIKDLEKANEILNDTIGNYDTTVQRLEKNIDEMDARYNKLLENYNLLIDSIRAVLPPQDKE